MHDKNLDIMNGVNFGNLLLKNINFNTQVSFIKIPKKKNNIERDFSTGRKYMKK